EEINIDVMFGVETNMKNADIEQWTSEYRDDLFPNSIIIGDTIQHGFIVFWLSNEENRGIYYYDDTYEFESSTDDMNTYFLANSFSEFLNMVEN
ncbi:SMI1/KNR4 family protein, partial [Streptococcus pneumoniae]